MINTFKASTVSFFLMFNLCFAQDKKANGITFKIIDKVLINNSCIKLVITNNSPFNYYLPILNAPDTEKWNFMLPTDETTFFFVHTVVYDLNNDNLGWLANNCFDGDLDTTWVRLDEKWKQKKKNIKIEDLILLKSGQTKVIKVPINLQVKLSNDCYWEIKDYKNKKDLRISYYYRKKQPELARQFLNSQLLEKLEKLNYKLYDMEIESNKVKLIF